MNLDYITNQIESVSFDLYSAEEIRRMSVKQITNPMAFDNLGRPTIAGLYDQSMGISPYDKTSICPTCNNDSIDCPGHFGHIELPACVYNPFAIGLILKLLNGKCFNCHKLRMREKDKTFFFLKILLIKLGLINESKQIEFIINGALSSNIQFDPEAKTSNSISNKIHKFIKSLKQENIYNEDIENFGESSNLANTNNNVYTSREQLRKSSDFDQSIQSTNTASIISNLTDNTQANTIDNSTLMANNTTSTGNNNNNNKVSKKDVDPVKLKLMEMNKRYHDSLLSNKENSLDGILLKISERIKEFQRQSSLNDQNTDIQLELKKTLKDFWSSMKLSKCPNCQAFQVKVKKQGYLKFFKMPLSNKRSKQQKLLGLDTSKDALISKTKDKKENPIDNDYGEEEFEGNNDNKDNETNNINNNNNNQNDSEVSNDAGNTNILEENTDKNDDGNGILNINDFKNNKNQKIKDKNVGNKDIKSKPSEISGKIRSKVVNKSKNNNKNTNEEDLFDSKEAKFLHPEEIREQIKRLWNRENDILSLVFGNIYKKGQRHNIFSIESSGADIFFIEAVLVPPIRFRPESRGGSGGSEDSVYLHQQSVILTKILNISADLKMYSDIVSNNSKNKQYEEAESNNQVNNNTTTNKNSNTIATTTNSNAASSGDKIATYKDIVSKWIELQDQVNIFYDGMKASKQQDKETTGIRQLLEKKEGIFRMKMMGKRVNYAGRSVISPDPMISTGEVGIPLYIASKLTFPEHVNDFNRDRLRQLIINGAFKYPGANMVEIANGKKLMLDTVKDDFRINKLAKSLEQTGNLDSGNNADSKFKVKVVYRHLQSGDALLVNRQPTLHKPSIMSHKAKVLPGEKTIRLHYSNCNSYNADFDGDEMNIHLLQSQIAREEAYSISNTENQYIVPTSGNPIRGLIQDSIVSAVILTIKDNFLSKANFCQLVYSALESALNSGKIKQIIIPEPAIMKPEKLFTGKQVITCILQSLVSNHPVFGVKEGLNNNNFIKESLISSIRSKNNQVDQSSSTLPQMNMEQKSKLNEDAFTQAHITETTVIIRGNELLTGIIDKNQIGNSSFGIIHSYFEIYGPNYAGELLTTFGKLFINYLQFFHGFTCGVGDILLTEETNLSRRIDVENIIKKGIMSLADMFDMKDYDIEFENLSNKTVNPNEAWFQKKDEYITEMHPDKQEDARRLIIQQNTKANKSSKFKDCKTQIQEIKAKIKKVKEAIKENSNNSTEENQGLQSKLEHLRVKLTGLQMKSRNHEKLEDLRTKLQEKLLFDDSVEKNIDNIVKSGINQAAKCANSWLSDGLIKKFPKNYFALMTLTGAKGSSFNHMQVSCSLGQQELEGRRVPRMASGKTLPSFDYYDPNPRAGGYISDRFGYGIRPQEFFFHCMAGREGLIDTAVKTSRSGYLQRCLIKHLEQLVVQYDNTVRDIDGKIIQFFYGEDGIDPVNSNFLKNYDFLVKNLDAYTLLHPLDKFNKNSSSNIDYTTLRDNNEPQNFDSAHETILSKFNPSQYIGSKSESSRLNSQIFSNNLKSKEAKRKFKSVVDFKYFKSIIQPGENVGILAAQSIGEPSTQMTLNTFHFAGHGVANMTLGIPRLREILMTSENNIKTPYMIIPTLFNDKPEIELLAREFERYFLTDIMREVITGTDIVFNEQDKCFERIYNIEMHVENLTDIYNYFNFSYKEVKRVLKKKFIPALAKILNKHYHLAKHNLDDGVVINKNKIFDEFNETMKMKQTNDNEEEKAANGEDEEKEEKVLKGRKTSERESENSEEESVDSYTKTRNLNKNGKYYDDNNDADGSEELEDNGNNIGEENSEPYDGKDEKGALVGKANDNDNEQELLTKSLNKKNISGTIMEIDEDDNNLNNNEIGINGDEADNNNDDQDLDEDLNEEALIENKKNKLIKSDEIIIKNNNNEIEDDAKITTYNCDSIKLNNILFNKKTGKFSFSIIIPYTQKPILVKNIIDEVLKQITFKYTNGIKSSHVEERKDPKTKVNSHVIFLEGVNFQAVFDKAENIAVNKIQSNDIGSILRIYGIEACRSAIIKEINNVFSSYNISVNPRHLTLVADYMTFQGEYRTFNRVGMELVSSPFLKVSFETSMNYLMQSCFIKESDFGNSSSSRIVLGLPPKVGTGLFDLKQNLINIPERDDEDEIIN